MAKRFTDTTKYKKSFIRSLPGAYKLLWDFLYHDCDHAGIWIVDFQIAQMYIGADMVITKEKALQFFNADEIRIVEIDGGKKWFIPSFIIFQYGTLSEKNRAHINVISVLNKYKLIDKDFNIKPLTSPLQGGKEKEKEQEQEQDFEKSEKLLDENAIAPQIVKIFKEKNPDYADDVGTDSKPALKIFTTIAKILKFPTNILAINTEQKEAVFRRWGELAEFIVNENFIQNYQLTQIANNIQSILLKEKNQMSSDSSLQITKTELKNGTGNTYASNKVDKQQQSIAKLVEIGKQELIAATGGKSNTA